MSNKRARRVILGERCLYCKRILIKKDGTIVAPAKILFKEDSDIKKITGFIHQNCDKENMRLKKI